MKKILVIEDQPQMRANLCELLMLEGYAALAAADGEEGLVLARREQPDLILCDIMMPRRDGMAVLAGVRADTMLASTPFIFLTARGERLDVRNGMNVGADDYLTKPVERADLLAAIAARLDRHRQQRGGPVNFDDPSPLESLGLSPREAEVLCWMAQGKSNAMIAEILGLSEATVKRHAIHIFAKLGVENRSSATLRAIEVLSRSG